MLQRPAADEFGSHFGTYIGLIDTDDVLPLLENNRKQVAALYSALTDEQALYRYAPDKWSLKEVLGHIADTERVMCYRMLRIARGDRTPLAGFDQDDYMASSGFDAFPVAQLLADYEAVRAATTSLTRMISPKAWARTGTASGTTMSARALACVIAGHELHHLAIIRLPLFESLIEQPDKNDRERCSRCTSLAICTAMVLRLVAFARAAADDRHAGARADARRARRDQGAHRL